MSEYLICDPNSLSDIQEQTYITTVIDFMIKNQATIHQIPYLEYAKEMLHMHKMVMIYNKKAYLTSNQPVATTILSSWLRQKLFHICRIKPFQSQKSASNFIASDTAVVDNCLYIGYGMDSEHHLTQVLSNDLAIIVRDLELIDRSYKHLSSIFKPLDSGTCLCYLPAFSDKSQNKIMEDFTVIHVPEQEVRLGACHAICIDNQVLIPTQCEQTAFMLSQHDYKVSFVDQQDSYTGPKDYILKIN